MRNLRYLFVFMTFCCNCAALELNVARCSPFIPNDPYYFAGTPVGYLGQWHLDTQSTGLPYDTNVNGAWERGLTGSGVTVAITEKQVDWSHPDLIENFASEHSWDFVSNAPLIEDVTVGAAHATAVAGVAAARGGNSIGTTGAAPYAKFASLAVATLTESDQITRLYDTAVDERFAQSIRFHNSADGTGINIKSYSYHPINPVGFTLYPLAEEAVKVATDEGAIIVFHAGNHRANHGVDKMGGLFGPASRSPAFEANITKSTIRRLPEVINVAAMNTNGKYAAYSSFGSNITVTVPVGDVWGDPNGGMTSTDTHGEYGYSLPPASNPFPDVDYAGGLTGTSFAAPLLSGILALAKEAQPILNTRFAKHLLARTSVVVDPTDSTPMGGWSTNAAGISFNNNYGFGLVDADALTQAATQFTGISELIERQTGIIEVGASVPLNNNDGITRTFTISGEEKIEEVIVNLRITSGNQPESWFSREDVEAWITSPSGVKSLLMYQNARDDHYSSTQGNIDWPFLTNAFWGERAEGEWAVTVRDVNVGYDDIGTYWDDFEVTFRTGELLTAVVNEGDFSGDGVVDGADFLMWQRDFGSTGISEADGDESGLVDGGDLVVWKDRYGAFANSPMQTVPEPSAIYLLCAIAVRARREQRCMKV